MNSNCNEKPIVYVATDTELRTESYYRRLWLAVRNKDIPRRLWLDELADAFRDAEVEIRHVSQEPFLLPDIDDVFDGDDMRWLSDYLKPLACGSRPKSRSRKLERLRILDLYFRITAPCIAAHFSK